MFINRAPAPWTMLGLKHYRSEWCLNLRPLTIKSIFFYGSCLLMLRHPRWEMIGDAWWREHFLSQLKCEEVLGKMQMGWNRAPRGMQQNKPRGKNKGSGGRQNWGHIDGEEATNIHAAFKVIWTPQFLLLFFSVCETFDPATPKAAPPLLCSGKWSKEKHLSLQRVCQRQHCPPCYILNYAERICMPVRKPVPISASEITFQ